MFQAVRWQPVLLSSCFLSMVTAFANAQTPGPYPNRALRLIVPTAPGGAADDHPGPDAYSANAVTIVSFLSIIIVPFKQFNKSNLF